MWTKFILLTLICVSATRAQFNMEELAMDVAQKIGEINHQEVENVVLIEEPNAESTVKELKASLTFTVDFDFMPYQCHVKATVSHQSQVTIRQQKCDPIVPHEVPEIMQDETDVFDDEDDEFDVLARDMFEMEEEEEVNKEVEDSNYDLMMTINNCDEAATVSLKLASVAQNQFDNMDLGMPEDAFGVGPYELLSIEKCEEVERGYKLNIIAMQGDMQMDCKMRLLLDSNNQNPQLIQNQCQGQS